MSYHKCQQKGEAKKMFKGIWSNPQPAMHRFRWVPTQKFRRQVICQEVDMACGMCHLSKSRAYEIADVPKKKLNLWVAVAI